AIGIIDLENQRPRRIRADIDGNEGNIFSDEFVEKVRLRAEGHDRDPFHFALDQSADKHACSFEAIVAGADHDLEIVFCGHVLKTLHEFREEGVDDLRNKKPQSAAAARDEGARLRIGPVPKLFNRPPNAPCEIPVHGWAAIRDAGNRGRRYPRALGDLKDIDATRAPFSSTNVRSHSTPSNAKRSARHSRWAADQGIPPKCIPEKSISS